MPKPLLPMPVRSMTKTELYDLCVSYATVYNSVCNKYDEKDALQETLNAANDTLLAKQRQDIDRLTDELSSSRLTVSLSLIHI